MRLIKNSIFHESIFVLILLLCAYVLYSFYTRGFIPHDEGWIINPAQRISQGDIPYRDFHYIYTPGVAYIIGLGFKLFGVSVLTSRLITMVVALATIYILIKITSLLTKVTYAYVPVVLYIVWMPMHINFAWPVIYAITSGLATCLLLLLFRKKKFISLIFFAGVTTGITLLCKQNFGLALLLNTTVSFILEKEVRNKKNILWYFLGVLILPAIMCIYFYFNHALLPFFNDIYFFMFQELILKGIQSTPFVYPDIWYKEIAKALLYLFPLLISVIAAIIVYKKNKSLVFLATFTGFYYLLGIRPTTDLMHLVPLISLTGIPLLLIFIYTNNRLVKISCICLFVSSSLLGIYSALYMNYYRWDTPMIQQNIYTANPRLGILTDVKYHKIIPSIADYIDAHTRPDNYLFIYSFSPSFYVLTDRKNPTKFIYLPISILSNRDQKEIIQNLMNKYTPLILTDISITSEKSKIAAYITSHYYVVKKVSNYTIWQKKVLIHT